MQIRQTLQINGVLLVSVFILSCSLERGGESVESEGRPRHMSDCQPFNESNDISASEHEPIAIRTGIKATWHHLMLTDEVDERTGLAKFDWELIGRTPGTTIMTSQL